MKECFETTYFIFNEKEVDKRNKLYKAVKDHGYVGEFQEQDETTLSRWVVSLVKKENMEIEPMAVATLLYKTGSDMEKLCNAIGKKISFFTNENFCLETVHPGRNPNIRFYAGNPTGEQNKVANNLLELMENIDEVLSARECFLNMR